MKSILILTIALIAPLPAIAGDINESPIRGKGAISAVHNEPAATNRSYTTEEINRALAASGQPPLGSARTLYDDNQATMSEPTGFTITRSWSRTGK